MLVINIVHSSINHQNLHSLLSVNPFLVSFVNSLEVIKTNFLLSFSVSDLNPLLANFWRTLQVNNTLDWAVLDEGVTDWVINFVLMRLEVSIFVHDFTENVSVGKRRPFWEKKYIFLFSGGIFPEKGSGMEGIELECESPSFGIGVVLFEDIDPADVFPEVDRLLDGLDVQEAEESRLAGS